MILSEKEILDKVKAYSEVIKGEDWVDEFKKNVKILIDDEHFDQSTVDEYIKSETSPNIKQIQKFDEYDTTKDKKTVNTYPGYSIPDRSYRDSHQDSCNSGSSRKSAC